MSQLDDEKTAEFFDKLAGKIHTDGASEDRGIAMLREALQNQLETIQQAEAAKDEILSGEELAKMNALKQQLIAKGLIGKSPPQQSKKDWLVIIHDFIFGTGWERPVALAASMLFAIALIWQINVPSEPDGDVVRGGEDTAILVVADPIATIEQLTKQLNQAGADVLPVQINDQEWTLRITVPKSVEYATIRKILAKHGIQVQGDPPYRFDIKNKQ